MQLALRTARIFWLKRTVKWLAVRPAPAPAGDPLVVSRFLPTRELTKQHHNPASHHECKNARHREAVATCTYRRTLGSIAAYIIFNGLTAQITLKGGKHLLSLQLSPFAP